MINEYIQLCNIGDILYKVTKHGIIEIKITAIMSYPHIVYRDNYNNSYFNRNIVKSCFKTKEEAIKEMQKRDNIKKKRELLKEYEKKLNEELNIGEHYIIK